jgi:TolB protein
MKIAGCCAALLFTGAVAAQAQGLFEGHQDVGTVLHAGRTEHDSASKTYTISASGENVWANADAFHYVWKKVSGDWSLTADISFPTKTGNPHKKGMLMFRQSLDADSPYADVAVHAEGLTSLQSRTEKGSATHEVQAAVSAPRQARIVKRGADFFVYLAAANGLEYTGASMRVELREPFYVGIGVCSHDKDVVEQAIFRNVELARAPGGKATPYSTLETITVSSTDRRVTYTSTDTLAAPTWTADGQTLVYTKLVSTAGQKGGAAAFRIPVAGGTPERSAEPGTRAELPDADGYVYSHSDRSGSMQIWRSKPDGSGAEQVTAGDMQNAFPHLAPNGRQLVFLSYAAGVKGIPERGPVTLRVMTLANKSIGVLASITGGQGAIDAPPWSPDSRRLAFVSYQSVPPLR